MNDGITPPTPLKKPFFTTSTGDTNPMTMLVWFTLLALALHIKSVYWLSQPAAIIKKTHPIEMTLLAVPLKTAAVEPIKPKPIDPPKKPPPLKAKPKPQPKPLPKPKPAIVAKPKLVAAQPNPIVKTAPMAKALKADPKEIDTIAPIVHAPVAAPIAQQPLVNSRVTAPVKSSTHTENVTKHNDEANDEVVEANYRPNYGSNPKPKYPAAAQRRHLEGKVLLTVRVSAEGDSEQVSILKSSGHEILDDVAVETVKKWKFVPGRKGSKAIATTVTVPINFKFND